MLKLLLLFTVLMLPAWAGKPVTDPELLRQLNAQFESKPDPIDRDRLYDCLLKHIGEAKTDAAVDVIMRACLHKTRR